jgi:hypothetical protein
MNFHLFFLLYDRTRHWRIVDLNRNTMPAKYRTFNHMQYTVVKAGGIFLLPRIFPSYFMKILQQIFRKNVLLSVS